MRRVGAPLRIKGEAGDDRVEHPDEWDVAPITLDVFAERQARQREDKCCDQSAATLEVHDVAFSFGWGRSAGFAGRRFVSAPNIVHCSGDA